MARLLDMMNKKKGAGKGDGNTPKPPEPPAPAAEPIQREEPAAPALQPSLPSPAPANAVAPAPKSGGAYEKDCAERTAFEAAKHEILEGTAPRIRFGRVLTAEMAGMGGVSTPESAPCTAEGHVPGYIWGLGKKPKGMAGGLALVGAKTNGELPFDAALYKLFVEASRDLKAYAITEEGGPGPFSDKDGAVAELADALFDGVGPDDINMMVEHVIDMRPFMGQESEYMCQRFFPSYNFRFDGTVVTPDELPTAGGILSQKDERLGSDCVTGANFYALVHPMEPYLLAVAALRLRGVNAYVAHAVTPAPDGESVHPLIAILDTGKEVPLVTFDMFRVHPAMGAIDILSDVAVEGATYAMLAEARIKHLVNDIIALSAEGKEMPSEEFGNQINRITRMLFESVKRWDGNHFIGNTMNSFSIALGQAILVSDINRFRAVNEAHVADMVDARTREILTSGVDPGQIRPSDPITVQAIDIANDVYLVTSNALATVQALLGAWITRAQAEGSRK